MFCKQCGSLMEEGERFCSQCGTDNAPSATSQAVATPPVFAAMNMAQDFTPILEVAQEQAPAKKKSKLWLWITLSVVGVALIVGVILLFVFQPWAGDQCYYCMKYTDCKSVDVMGKTGWFCDEHYPFAMMYLEEGMQKGFGVIHVSDSRQETVCSRCNFPHRSCREFSYEGYEGMTAQICDECYEAAWIVATLTTMQTK